MAVSSDDINIYKLKFGRVIMKLKNVKADLHAHGWTGQETGFGQFGLTILGERGKTSLLCGKK